eukprot:2581779-Rhodomonas_salina.1
MCGQREVTCYALYGTARGHCERSRAMQCAVLREVTCCAVHGTARGHVRWCNVRSARDHVPCNGRYSERSRAVHCAVQREVTCDGASHVR